MGVFVDVAVTEGDGDEACTEFFELVIFGKAGVFDAAFLFEVADAPDLCDIGFDFGGWLVCGIN